MEYRFIVDAEVDGLYGPLLTMAVLVTKLDGTEVASFYGGVPKQIVETKEAWVLEHVIPYIGAYQAFATEEELLEEVWQLWCTYRTSARCFADVPFPVESRVFHKMVEKDRQNRAFMAPFPIIDVASLLFARGFEPIGNRLDLVSHFEGRLHNALDDVRLSSRIIQRLLGE